MYRREETGPAGRGKQRERAGSRTNQGGAVGQGKQRDRESRRQQDREGGNEGRQRNRARYNDICIKIPKQISYFSITSPTLTKKKLYQSLVLPILTYCSPVWRPFLLQDITALEKVQRRATKYIVNDSSLNYKDRLMKLNMLPLMYLLEIADIIAGHVTYSQSQALNQVTCLHFKSLKAHLSVQ